jgi:4-hydroxythreonine-4-phosphate dehydrogenase
MFGNEEEECIAPAVIRYSGPGELSGPWPPDTVFHKAAAGDFDAVIAMYHDQGLIPFKLLHFKDGVNVTLGLPIVRTSVDHGTAYDIAGQGLADCTSLEAAVQMASSIVMNRKKGAPL